MTDGISRPTPEQEVPQTKRAAAVAVAAFTLGLLAVQTLSPAESRTTAERASAPTAPRAQHDTIDDTIDADDATGTAPVAGSGTGSETDTLEATEPIGPAPPSTPRATHGDEQMPPTDRPDTSVRGGVSAPRAAPGIASQPPSAPSANANIGATRSTVRPQRHLMQGRVAYLRCDGLDTVPGRFPCPRDPALEQAVWEVLERLTQCAPDPGAGGADVRLDFGRGKQTEVRVMPIPRATDPSLDLEATRACVATRLTRLSTDLDPLYMVVSFRVELN